MGRKRKRKHRAPEQRSGPKERSTSRASLVLAIVETDATFNAIVHPRTGEACWAGRCIHCSAQLIVDLDGSTAATVEHLVPLCGGGAAADPRNLALACGGCNNEKGIRHDRRAGRGGRADEVIAALLARRAARWHEPGAGR